MRSSRCTTLPHLQRPHNVQCGLMQQCNVLSAAKIKIVPSQAQANLHTNHGRNKHRWELHKKRKILDNSILQNHFNKIKHFVSKQDLNKYKSRTKTWLKLGLQRGGKIPETFRKLSMGTVATEFLKFMLLNKLYMIS